MSFNIDSQYVFYAFAALSAILFVEAIYLLFFSNASYRKRINRRLDLMKGQANRESVLVQLRRERGLTSDGDLRLPLQMLNRLILQSLVELEAYGKDDARRGIGSGLSTAEAGLRLRYEITRQFAPYIGVVREWSFGRTADLRRGEGEATSDTRFVAGIRVWF